MDFAVDNKYFHATIRKEAGRLNQTHLLSNEPAYVEHFKSIFEELWKNGIDATERIKDIDTGANLAENISIINYIFLLAVFWTKNPLIHIRSAKNWH